MRYSLFKYSFFALVLFLDSCIQPFSPPEVNSPDTYLVVDGFLNASQDTSKIELRRTQNTNESTDPVMETGATLSVTGETGEVFNFNEQKPGSYILLPTQLNMSGKYSLRIKTAGGKEYVSDYVSVSKTPPIDSVTYKVDQKQNTMVFYINTHDSQNLSRFYRWKFEESWQYNTQLFSSLEVVGSGDDRKIIDRKQNINTCYTVVNSSSIILGSTIKLSQDVIKDLPINLVPISTNRLLYKYSIMVKQYTLSQEAFEYWTALSKTTQGTGSLFDPLPSQVTGNIKNVKDPQELVFGYFGAAIEQKKRIFLNVRLGRLPICVTDTLPVQCLPRAEKECALQTGALLLYYADPRQNSVVVADPVCADCRISGGTTTKPWFWE